MWKLLGLQGLVLGGRFLINLSCDVYSDCSFSLLGGLRRLKLGVVCEPGLVLRSGIVMGVTFW